MSDRRKRETQLQKEIVAALSKLGFIALRINSGSVRVRRGYLHLAPKGTPDVVVQLRDGRIAWIEVKFEDGESSEEQVRWAERIRASNGIHIESRSLNDAVERILAA